MTKILLSGCGGKMGRVIASCVADREDCEIVAGIDPAGMEEAAFPVFGAASQFDGQADPRWRGYSPMPFPTTRRL